MLLEGQVINGIIVLDEEAKLAEGTRVEVAIKSFGERSPTAADIGDRDEAYNRGTPTLISLLDFAGTLGDLPADFAAEHDHYIHGTPKRNQPGS